MPGQLPPDAVGDGRHKLPSQAQLGAQLEGKLFGAVLLLGHVPLKLVHQGDVAHVDVQLKRKNGDRPPRQGGKVAMHGRAAQDQAPHKRCVQEYRGRPGKWNSS